MTDRRTDRQTDRQCMLTFTALMHMHRAIKTRQTDEHHMTAYTACIASHGKNRHFYVPWPSLQHVAMHKRGYCRHAVSVHLSVTLVSCTKTNKDIFKIFSPRSSFLAVCLAERHSSSYHGSDCRTQYEYIVEVEEVQTGLSKIKLTKAVGPDNVSHKIP